MRLCTLDAFYDIVLERLFAVIAICLSVLTILWRAVRIISAKNHAMVNTSMTITAFTILCWSDSCKFLFDSSFAIVNSSNASVLLHAPNTSNLRVALKRWGLKINSTIVDSATTAITMSERVVLFSEVPTMRALTWTSVSTIFTDSQ